STVPGEHLSAQLDEATLVQVRLHAIHLPCHERNIVPYVPEVRIGPIDRDQGIAAGVEAEWAAAVETPAILLIEESGQIRNINVDVPSLPDGSVPSACNGLTEADRKG